MKNYPNFPYNQPQGVAFLYALKHLDRILWDMSRGLTPSAESLNDLAVYMNIIQTMGASDA